MSTRRATAATRAPAASGATRLAQLLAYDGPIVERAASAYPVSTTQQMTELVNQLKVKLSTWAPMVLRSFQIHNDVHVTIDPYDTEWQKESREKMGDFRALQGIMEFMFTNMSAYVSAENYLQVRNDPERFLFSIVDQLDVGQRRLASLLGVALAGH